jgi:hypothetical protein
MRSIHLLAVALSAVLVSSARGADPPAGKADTPFWLAPQVKLDFAPTAVTLASAPEDTQSFALLQVGDLDPRVFVVSNPKSLPFQTRDDAGYGVVAGGLKVGAFPYGDRKYKVQKLPEALSGLTLLRTKMGGTDMIRTVAFVPLAKLLLSPALADEPEHQERPAAEMLSAAVARAKDQGKRVFLLFGSPG